MSPRLKIAVIGTGVAGMVCAWLLRESHDVRVYERNDYVGGHTNTVLVPEEGREVAVDTGFMVYNEPTYPNLTRLFRTLGVQTMPAPMSFSVQHLSSGLEFAGKGLNSLFAQRRNLFRPRHYRLLKEIARFNATAARALDDPGFENDTLRDYLEKESFSSDFRDHYLIPMSGAVWSTPPEKMLDFPAVTLIRFFKNHAFLGMSGQHPWRTVSGGSRRYRDRIVSDLADRIWVNRAAVRVTSEANQAVVLDTRGERHQYDRAVIATHADEALALLGDATSQERRLLGCFRYQENLATLHTDEAVMPRNRLCWSSWNYRSEGQGDGASSSVVYWMNDLQKVSTARNYFVSINDPGRIDDTKIVKKIVYQHPLFDLASIRSQSELPALHREGTRLFCGSYFRYGFHEDALNAGLEVCRLLKGGDPWA